MNRAFSHDIVAAIANWCSKTVAIWITAKQIVSQLIYSLSKSPLFARDLEQNFFSNLLQQLECMATKLCVYKMADAVQGLKQDFIPITLLIIVAPILKVVRNVLQTSYLVHTDSSIRFKY